MNSSLNSTRRTRGLASIGLLIGLTFALSLAGCAPGGSEGMEGADMTGATNKPTPLPSSVPKGATSQGGRTR